MDDLVDEWMKLVDEIVVWCAPSPVWAEAYGASPAPGAQFEAVREGQEVGRG